MGNTDGNPPLCPVCGEPASDVSWTTADGQAVCTSDGPVNTWDPDAEVPVETHEVVEGDWNTLKFECSEADVDEVTYDVELGWTHCPHCGALLVEVGDDE